MHYTDADFAYHLSGEATESESHLFLRHLQGCITCLLWSELVMRVIE